MKYLGDPQNPDVGTGRGGAVPGSKQTVEHTGHPLHENTPGTTQATQGLTRGLTVEHTGLPLHENTPGETRVLPKGSAMIQIRF